MTKRKYLNGASNVDGKEIRNRVCEFGRKNGITKLYQLIKKIGLKEGTYYHIIYSNRISPENAKQLGRFIKLDDLIENTSMSNYETK